MTEDPFSSISHLLESGDSREANRAYARAQAAARGLDPDFVDRLFTRESGYNRKALNKETGAAGIGQMIPGTRRRFGLRDPFDAKEGIDKSLNYLESLHKRFGGDQRRIAAGYFAGEEQSDAALANPKGNPKTKAYADNVAGDPFANISHLLERNDKNPEPQGSEPDRFADIEHLLEGAKPRGGAKETTAPLPAGSFEEWYSARAQRLGLNPNPDDPQHHYDYRAAFAAGAEPDPQTGHWPSQFKSPDHPNRFVMQGSTPIDSVSGQPATEQQLAAMTPEQQKTFAALTGSETEETSGPQSGTRSQTATARLPAGPPQVNVYLGDPSKRKPPTIEELSGAIAHSLGFTPEEAAEYTRTLGRNPFYGGAKDEAAAMKSVLARTDPSTGMVSIPAMHPDALASTQRWLQEHRRGKTQDAAYRQSREELYSIAEIPDEAERIQKAGAWAVKYGPLDAEDRQMLKVPDPSASGTGDPRARLGSAIATDAGSIIRGAGTGFVAPILKGVGRASEFLTGSAEGSSAIHRFGQFIQQRSQEREAIYGRGGAAGEVERRAGAFIPMLFVHGPGAFATLTGLGALGEGRSAPEAAVEGALSYIGLKGAGQMIQYIKAPNIIRGLQPFTESELRTIDEAITSGKVPAADAAAYVEGESARRISEAGKYFSPGKAEVGLSKADSDWLQAEIAASRITPEQAAQLAQKAVEAQQRAAFEGPRLVDTGSGISKGLEKAIEGAALTYAPMVTNTAAGRPPSSVGDVAEQALMGFGLSALGGMEGKEPTRVGEGGKRPGIEEVSREPLAKPGEARTLEGTGDSPVSEPPQGTRATWNKNGVDIPVTVVGDYGTDSTGRRYVRIAESETGVPVDELGGAPGTPARAAAGRGQEIVPPATPQGAVTPEEPPTATAGTSRAKTPQIAESRRSASSGTGEGYAGTERRTSEQGPPPEGERRSLGRRAREYVANKLAPEQAVERETAKKEAKTAKGEARTDALTGVLNQRAWQEARGVETYPDSGIFKGGVDESPDRAVVHGDLDNFKTVNDTHPRKYKEGDRALAAAFGQAQKIATEIDPTAKVYRSGIGDELTVDAAAGKEAEIAKAINEGVRVPIGKGFDDVTMSTGYGKTYDEAAAAMGKNKLAGKAARTTAKATVDQAAHEAATSPTNQRPEPTPPQIAAGNYKKGHVRIAGFDVSVENPKGAIRLGTDSSGKQWSAELKSHYGYIRSFRPTAKGAEQRRIAETQKAGGLAHAVPSGKERVDLAKVVVDLVPRVRALNAALPKNLAKRSLVDAESRRDTGATKALTQQLKSLLEIPTETASGDVNAALNQASADWLDADTHFFGDLGDARAIRSQGFNSLNVERQATVHRHMLTALHDVQVRRGILQLLPVDVMDMLSRGKRSPKSPRSNESMLLDRLAAPLDDSVRTLVARVIDSVATRLPIAFASRIAEEVPSLSKSVSRADKSGSTGGTGSVSHSGYVSTIGADGEHIDVFIKPKTKPDYSGPVFVVNQTKGNGHFDEHKIMLGWQNEQAAREGYLANYDKSGPSRIGTMTRFENPKELKTWLDSGNLTRPATEPSRRKALYDQLAASRRTEPRLPAERKAEEHFDLFQASGLSTVEVDRVRAKYEDLKKRGENVEDYLRQGGLFGHELNAGQQELLREMAAPKTRRGAAAEQGALFESTPTVESRQAKPKEFQNPRGSLFQADTAEGQRIINDVVDDFHKEGIRDFREAAKKFSEEFGPSSEYSEMFEKAWDAHEGVKKRGRLTFDRAVSAPELKSESLSSAIIRLGRLKSTGFEGKGEQKMISPKEGGRIGLFSEKGWPVEDMISQLENEGWQFGDQENSLNNFHEALRDEVAGKPHYASGDLERMADAEWEKASREEFVEKSDYAIMSRAFDNPNDPEYKEWIDAYDAALNPRRTPTDEDIQFFKEASRELGLGDETINRHLAAANDYRRNEANVAQGTESAEGGRGAVSKDEASLRPNQLDRSRASVPTNRSSFKQALINRWGYDEEVAHRTSEVMEGFADAFVYETKLTDPKASATKVKEDFYRSLLVAGPGERGARSLEQSASFQQARAATEFVRTGEATIRALEEPDESSGIHEIKHAVTPLFFKLAAQPSAPEGLKTTMRTIEQWMGLESGEFVELHQKWIDGTATDQEADRYRRAQERDARGFERYLREGKAPTAALKAAFAKFAEWLSKIYRQIKHSAIDVDITDQMRRAWDRMLGSEREKAEALVDENEQWNFKRSSFASRETETAFREIVRKATVEAGTAHKDVVTREAHLERVGELHPDLIKQVGGLRTSQIASREIFTAASQYAQTLTRQAQDLRSKITDSTPPMEKLSIEDKIAALEHDATEIMAHTIGVRSEFGRNLALLATQKTDQLSPEKVLAFGAKLAEQAGMDKKSPKWRATQYKLTGLSNEIQGARDEKKRIAEKEKEIREGKAKPKKQGWQTAMLSNLKSQAQEASDRLQATFGKKLYQKGERRNSILHQEAELPEAAHDIATILAARVAEESNKKGGLPLGRLIEDMRNGFPDVINQFEEPIKAAADAILKDARRKALVDAARDPEQRLSARQELGREISDAKRVVREAEKALETKTRQMEKAWESDAERAEKEATRAWDKANDEFEKSLEGRAKDADAADRLAERQAHRAFARQQRLAVAKEARDQVRAAKDAEAERLRTIADDARDQLKEVRRAVAEALTYGRRWDFPIREAARLVRERMSAPDYEATVADLAAIGAEKNLDPHMTPQRWHREMGAQGEAYSKNATKIRDAVADLRATARADFNRRKLEEKAAGARAGATNIGEREQAREDYQAWAARRLEELAAERQWQERREREAKRDLAKEFAKLEKVPVWERALDVFGLPISLASSIDLPHLRQGLPTLMNHPKIWAESLFKSVSTWTEGQMDKRLDELENHPLAELIRASGLKQSGLEARRNPLSSLAHEEQFQNRLARKLPHVRVSERQYTTAMDVMRAQVFSLHATPLLADLPPSLHLEVYQEIARITNIMTGVGDLGSLTKYAPILNRFLLYATRYLVSRFQMLGMLRSPLFYRSQPWAVRRIAAREAYGYVAKLAALFGVAAAFGLTSLDPDDDDFLKIHMPGTSQRWDVTGGLGPFVKMLFKLARSGVRKVRGQPEFKNEGTWDTLKQFGRSKLAPVPATIVDAGTGRTFTGEPLEWDKKALSLVAPMIASDVAEAIKADGARGLIMIPFALLGGNVSSYPSRKMPDRTGSEAERYATGMLREKMGDKPETPAEYKRRTAITSLVIAQKSGKPTDRIMRDIEKAGGPLTDSEAGKVKERVRETPLQHSYRGLGEDEKQQVLDVATEEEKKQVEPKYQTMAERVRALTESDAYKEMTPAEKEKARKEILSRTRTEDPDLRKTTAAAVLQQEVRTAKARVIQELVRRSAYDELTDAQKEHVKDVVGQPFDGLEPREVRGRLSTVSVRAMLSIPRELQKARSYHKQAAR